MELSMNLLIDFKKLFTKDLPMHIQKIQLVTKCFKIKFIIDEISMTWSKSKIKTLILILLIKLTEKIIY